MITFCCAILLLIVGYFLYGKLAEKVFRPDDRPTPAVDHPDGVDYVPMKTWRVFLIQLLNIAGTGPIFGALMGAVFGPVVFLWIVFGSILGGAIHDYMSGMISVRMNGASISEIVGKYLGRTAKQVMRVFSVVLLVLVGAVFTTSPAALIARLTPDWMNTTFWVVVILVYYLLATLLPIDKLIGKLYPVFGVVLVLMAVGIIGGLVVGGYHLPELSFVNQHPGWPAGLAVHVCHGGLRRGIRLPRHPVAHDGTVPQAGKGRAQGVLRRHDRRERHRPGLGGGWRGLLRRYRRPAAGAGRSGPVGRGVRYFGVPAGSIRRCFGNHRRGGLPGFLRRYGLPQRPADHSRLVPYRPVQTTQAAWRSPCPCWRWGRC